MADEKQDSILYVNIAGVDYAARDGRYSASVLKLADTFEVTIPAPDGKVRGTDGTQTKIADVATMGAKVELSIADPNVNGGARILKLIGVVTGRQMKADTSGGTVLVVSGADLGWWLSSCGRVFTNLRGVKWTVWLQKNLGLTVDAAGNVTNDAFGWGFKGVRGGNFLNRRLRLGRQTAQSDFQQLQSPSIVEPVFQIDVGQTLDSLMIQYAKLDHFLINVSTDGYLQFFQPDYSQKASYVFNHYLAGDDNAKKNNVMGPTVTETADPLYTKVECWSTVIDTIDNDPFNPNAGRYHGTFTNTGTLPGLRLYTFTDTEQMGQSRVDARAKWQWQRGIFDSWSYTFETIGHSQGGIPFVEDTMAELHDEVFGYDGLYYVSSVEPTRKLAKAGFDKDAGTRCRVTLKKPNLLAA